MSFKCAVQVMGLTRGDPMPNAKHRMKLRKATMEAGYERASLSETLVKERSKFNRYSGYKKGEECADVMEAESEFVTITMKDGTQRQRKNRSNVVPGFAIIINPPWEVSQCWTDSVRQKFYQDTWECMKLIKPNIFRDDNVMMRSEHFDEGVIPKEQKVESRDELDPHLHIIGYARDENGKWVGNEIDGKMLHDMNVVYPQMMRDRGWDLEDLDVTDFDKAKHDEVYREERKAKRKSSGLSVNAHIRRKTQQTANDANQLLEDTIQLQKEIEEMQKQIERDRNAAQQQIQADRSEMEKEVEEREKELEEQKKLIAEQKEQLQTDASRLKSAINDIEIIRAQDTDMSRKKFMEKLHGKNSKSAEEMYQDYLSTLAAERKATLDRWGEIADQYAREHKENDLGSLERQTGRIP